MLGKDLERAGSKWDACHSESGVQHGVLVSDVLGSEQDLELASNWDLLAEGPRDPFKLLCLKFPYVSFLCNAKSNQGIFLSR